MPRVLGIAMRTAIARQGVAVVIIPGDIALRHCNSQPLSLDFDYSPSGTLPSSETLEKAAKVLNDAETVTILGGAGCARAREELIEVAGRLKAPIVHALRGKEFIEYDNPYDVGMTGLLGFASGYRAMEHCDALLMLGTDFPYRNFFPERARIVQVDIRGENIGRRISVDVPLVGTVKDTVSTLLPRLRTDRDDGHLSRMVAHYRRTRKRLDALTANRREAGPLHPQAIIAAVDRLAADDAVFVPDVGLPTLWASRYLRMNGTARGTAYGYSLYELQVYGT